MTKRSPSRRFGRAASRAAILAAFLAVAPFWLRAIRDARDALRTARAESLEAQIGAERAPGFLDAVDRVQKAVPAHGSYLLMADPFGPGALTAIAFRHALLPRRAILAQRYAELAGQPPVRPRVTVMIEDDETAPAVLGRVAYLESLDPATLGTRDDSLEASVDEVLFDARGVIRIRGWCQGRGAVPCDVAGVLVNGRMFPVTVLSREPRPDVEAAVPSVGPCPQAGYCLTLPRRAALGERVAVRVVFRTNDGRWRIYPEQVSRRTP